MLNIVLRTGGNDACATIWWHMLPSVPSVPSAWATISPSVNIRYLLLASGYRLLAYAIICTIGAITSQSVASALFDAYSGQTLVSALVWLQQSYTPRKIYTHGSHSSAEASIGHVCSDQRFSLEASAEEYYDADVLSKGRSGMNHCVHIYIQNTWSHSVVKKVCFFW